MVKKNGYAVGKGEGVQSPLWVPTGRGARRKRGKRKKGGQNLRHPVF